MKRLPSRENSAAGLAIARDIRDGVEGLVERVRHLEAENAALRDRALADEEAILRAERSRVAEHLHDGVAQTLALAMLKLEIIARLIDQNPAAARLELEKAVTLMESCVYELRSAVYSLRSPDVERLGFRRALDRLAAAMNDQMNVEVALSVPDTIPLPASSQLLLFQMLQERLDQIAKAGSSAILSVSVAVAGARLTATVEEEGFRGFKRMEDPAAAARLRRQRDQLARLGGTLREYVESARAILEIVLPVEPEPLGSKAAPDTGQAGTTGPGPD